MDLSSCENVFAPNLALFTSILASIVLHAKAYDRLRHIKLNLHLVGTAMFSYVRQRFLQDSSNPHIWAGTSNMLPVCL